jgi:3-hydroxyisobutyrate dehydrogenase|tara:strand:- start:305 stop:1189 length:885 start_codon:yes stop_codon:yes gene_type:complete
MKIGFIGLGLMGKWMAKNILSGGHELTINDLNPDLGKELTSIGAKWKSTPSEVAAESNLVFTSLPNPKAVISVTLGENGILSGINSGSSYFDLSTTDPDTIKEISTEAAKKNVFVFDSPVSGGTIGAREGTLCIMVGGNLLEYEKYKPILQLMGNQTLYCGEVGSGATCKIVNNLIAMTLKVVLSEALSIGIKAGVPTMKLYEAISMSTGDTQIMHTFPNGLFSGNFNPGFKLALGAKDLGLAIKLAESLDLPTEIAPIVQRKFLEALERGWGEESTHSVARLQEELSGILIRK